MPVEALSNALTNYSKPVTWDKKTSSVYVGKVLIAPQTDITELVKYSTEKRGLTEKEINSYLKTIK